MFEISLEQNLEDQFRMEKLNKEQGINKYSRRLIKMQKK